MGFSIQLYHKIKEKESDIMYSINYKFDINDLIAAYLRKSQADDPDEPVEITLAKHKERILEAAKRYGINENQIVFFEEVVSGDTIAERPQIQKLLNQVNEGLYKGVLVVAVDRFSRGDSIDQGIINNSFYYSDTLIITPDKIYDITNNEMDREQLEFGLFLSKREYNIIKKRMYQGRIDNVKKGYFVGSYPPFGYDKILSDEKRGYILIPNENAKIVKEMFNMAINNKGAVKIAKYLNSLGIAPRRSKKWSASMVRHVLSRPVYYGIIQWGENTFIKKMENGKIVKKAIRKKDFLEVQGKHEPIVTKEIFDEAHRIMNSNSPKVVSSKKLQNPLAGLIICGYCLEHENIIKFMKRKPGSDKKIVNNKIRYSQKETIMCNNIDCQNVSIELSILEKRIIESLNKTLDGYIKYLNNYEKEYKLDKKVNNNSILNIEKELNKNRKQLKKAQEYYELEDYTREEFLNRKEELNKQYDSLIKEKENLTKELNNNKITIIRKQIPKLKKCIDNYYSLETAEKKNNLLKSIIKKVVYTKKEKGSYDKNLIDKFELEIELIID